MRFEAPRMTSGGKENSMKNQVVVGILRLFSGRRNSGLQLSY